MQIYILSPSGRPALGTCMFRQVESRAGVKAEVEEDINIAMSNTIS
jgi:hypothetical protein